MTELRRTIQRLTNDMNSLMRELSAEDDFQARRLIDEMVTSEVTSNFRASVDAMRNLLWIYIEAISRNREESARVVKSVRLQQAVDMLRGLHSDNVPEHFEDSGTFFEHIQKLVDDYNKDEESARLKHDAA